MNIKHTIKYLYHNALGLFGYRRVFISDDNKDLFVSLNKVVESEDYTKIYRYDHFLPSGKIYKINYTFNSEVLLSNNEYYAKYIYSSEIGKDEYNEIILHNSHMASQYLINAEDMDAAIKLIDKITRDRHDVEEIIQVLCLEDLTEKNVRILKKLHHIKNEKEFVLSRPYVVITNL